jgi:hypothetical protein
VTGIDPNEIYRQQYAHFGRMNDILYKLPVLFSSLIGALWYFAFTFLDKSRFVSAVVLLFAAVLSVVFIFVVKRFRLAFNGYIKNINEMDGPMKVTIKGGWSTMSLIEFVLASAALLSVISFTYAVGPWFRSLMCTHWT